MIEKESTYWYIIIIEQLAVLTGQASQHWWFKLHIYVPD